MTGSSMNWCEVSCGRWRQPALNIQFLGIEIGTSLNIHVKANNLGRVFGADAGFLLARNPDTVRAPDAAFVRRERVEEVGIPSGYWPGPPDLAIEITSPNDRYTEVYEKVDEWLEAGAGMVVVVNPTESYRYRSHRRDEPGYPA